MTKDRSKSSKVERAPSGLYKKIDYLMGNKRARTSTVRVRKKPERHVFWNNKGWNKKTWKRICKSDIQPCRKYKKNRESRKRVLKSTMKTYNYLT